MRSEGNVYKEFVSKDVMDALKNIGLNLYERKLYTALLSKGTATAGELADISGVPRARVYDVLETLADKGFVLIKNTRPISYVAVPPREAITRAAQRLQENLKRHLERLEEFKQSEFMEELERLHKERLETIDASELIATIKGKYSVAQQEESILRGASNKIDILVSSKGLSEIYRRYGAVLQEAAEKGIKIRILTPFSPENESIIEHLSEFAEIKDLNKLKDKAPYTNMLIADNKEVVLAMTHDEEVHPTQHTSIWTASKHFAQNFASKTFDLLWEMI